MNVITIPREINKWLQTLDLSYKISNVRRDLSNGFLIAEILSRYPKTFKGESFEFDMRSFGTGLSLDEKKTNWVHLKKLFEFNKIPISDEIIMKVISQAPNASFDLLCGLYKFLTKKDVFILRKVDETDQFKQYDPVVPKYMRPIANTILRDHEIQRIKDDLTRINRIEEVLRKHKEFLDEERYLFTKTKSWSFKKAQKRKFDLLQEERKRMRTHNELDEITENQKTDNISTSRNELKKEEKVNLLGSFKELGKTLNDYNIENEFKEIIKKIFIETDHDVELELKKWPDESDIIEFFFDKIIMCSEEKLHKIFLTFEEKQAKFIDIIGKTLLEINSFLKIFTRLFDILVKNSLPVEQFKDTTYSICLGVLSKDDLKCESIFLNYGLSIILDEIKVSPVYRSEMCKIIFSLISNNNYSHYEVLQQVRKRFANTDEVLYYHILVQCMSSYLNEHNLDNNIFVFYETAIIKGINSNCDVIRTKSIYMVTLSMVYDQMNSLTHAGKIFKHSKSWNWEILSLIVIYCARILLYYNSSKEDKERAVNMELDENMKNELKELEERLVELEKWEETFLKTVDSIIQISSPNNTLKIGFIYLANILHYYPSLAEKYMRLLIEFNYPAVRQQVLEIEHANLEMEYTGNCLAEKYKICGAPLLWNPTFIAEVFRDYILNNDIQSLNETNLEILHSIIINQEFSDSDADQWINFYSDMKPYIFVSFSHKEFSNISLNICQKLFTFEKILPFLLTETFGTFISTMTYIYDAGLIDYEHDNVSPENMKILLTFISEIKSNECQSYIYKLIKTFAIQNNDVYLKSNLLDLMNKISQEQRGDIFD